MSEQLAHGSPEKAASRTGTVAVVLSWNDVELVRDCLVRLGRSSPRPDHVVVVDNGSDDDLAPAYRAALPGVEIVQSRRNVGFAAAVNMAILRAAALGARWVWLVNSDTEVQAGTLARLLAAAATHPRAGLVAPVLLDRHGQVQAWGGGSASLWTGVSRHARGACDRIDYLSGACLLVSMQMLGDVGGLDERFFFYWEDVDLSFRAREAGWQLVVADACRVVHYEATALGPWSSARWFRLFEGLALFLRARAPLPALALCVRLLHHSAIMIRHRRWPALRGAWRGAVAGWRDA
ncbi:MAG TPA: glycosyltransferase family 2 protein [Candidatus Limnocylindrales bacterium]|nr:glycosyltransferase family 2 protein [Candidatus Limnocylindrales bacterium]